MLQQAFPELDPLLDEHLSDDTVRRIELLS
jgi:hypothetical protein